MASQLDVANMALARLRVSVFISDLTESTNEARVCSRFIDTTRQEVLRDFPYNFSLKSAALVEVADQTFPGWTYVYQYPDDCLNVRYVGTDAGMRSVLSNIFTDDCSTWNIKYPWQIALKNDNASRVILCDLDSAYVYYTADVSGIGLMPPDFVSLWADRLAMEIGGPLQADDSKLAQITQSYFWRRSFAQQGSLNEEGQDFIPESPSIQARY